MKHMIDSTEAIALREYIVLDLMRQALYVVKAHREHLIEGGEQWGDELLFATLYNAGRVDGIRRERARRLPR